MEPNFQPTRAPSSVTVTLNEGPWAAYCIENPRGYHHSEVQKPVTLSADSRTWSIRPDIHFNAGKLWVSINGNGGIPSSVGDSVISPATIRLQKESPDSVVSFTVYGLEALVGDVNSSREVEKIIGQVKLATRIFYEELSKRITCPPSINLIFSDPKEGSESPITRNAAFGGGLRDLFAPAFDLKTFKVDVPPGQGIDSIGGQPLLKQELRELLSQLKNPDHFKKYGVSRPRGVLFYGPPGTGKTLAVRALTSEMAEQGINCPLFCVRGSELVSCYYGEGEKNVKALFEQLPSNSILFIDEIDALAARRDGAHEATRRMLTEFLQSLDGMMARDDRTFICATNRPEDLDPAFKRAGRIDVHLFVPPPDLAGLEEILKIHVNASNAACSDGIKNFGEIAFPEVARACQGLVGADIKEIVNRAARRHAFAALRDKNAEGITTPSLISEVAAFKVEKAQVNSIRPWGVEPLWERPASNAPIPHGGN